MAVCYNEWLHYNRAFPSVTLISIDDVQSALRLPCLSESYKCESGCECMYRSHVNIDRLWKDDELI